jgi:hypothetical protein
MKIYDKRDEFDFGIIVNYPHLDGDVPHATSYGVYVSLVISFSRACRNVKDFKGRNSFITSKLQAKNTTTAFINYINILQYFTIVTLI